MARGILAAIGTSGLEKRVYGDGYAANRIVDHLIGTEA